MNAEKQVWFTDAEIRCLLMHPSIIDALEGSNNEILNRLIQFLIQYPAFIAALNEKLLTEKLEKAWENVEDEKLFSWDLQQVDNEL